MAYPDDYIAHNANTYPRTWQIGPLDSVHMSYENSRHYSIDDPIGELEWNSTLPTGGAVIYLGPQRTPFTVSLFHQLRCLNIVRAGIVNHHSTNNNIHNDSMQDWALITHCMNYLRQMILCHMDVTMESVRTTVGRGITVWDITHTCKDWSVVYQAAERNYRG